MFEFNLTPEWRIEIKDTLWYIEHIPCGKFYAAIVENKLGEEVNFSPKQMFCQHCYKNLPYELHAEKIKELMKIYNLSRLDVQI